MSATAHAPGSADGSGPRTEAERELARALELLEEDESGSVTLAALRELGVKAPAQAMYDLQLAGYTIDRVTSTDQAGQTTPAYRLRRGAAPPPGSPGTRTGPRRLWVGGPGIAPR